jgi:uncharacterized protein (TIGR02246 family)
MRNGLSRTVLFTAVLGVLGNGQSVPRDEERIRTLITDFANARNAHDGQAAAAKYSEDGEWIATGGLSTVKGRVALSQLWGGVEGQVQRTVEAIAFPAPNIATVRVATQYAEPIGLHHEVFVVVKDSWTNQWSIRVHQTI